MSNGWRVLTVSKTQLQTQWGTTVCGYHDINRLDERLRIDAMAQQYREDQNRKCNPEQHFKCQKVPIHGRRVRESVWDTRRIAFCDVMVPAAKNGMDQDVLVTATTVNVYLKDSNCVCCTDGISQFSMHFRRGMSAYLNEEKCVCYNWRIRRIFTHGV